MIASVVLSSVQAAYLATHDLRVITCNGGEATPSYMRMMDILALQVGKGAANRKINKATKPPYLCTEREFYLLRL